MRFRLQLCCLVGLLAAHAAPVSASAPRDIVFVVDTSGSIGSAEIEGLKRGLSDALGLMSSEDRFNIIQFASSTRLLFELPRRATPDNVGMAIEWLSVLEPGGGTELREPVQAALDQLRASPRPDAQVVLITDGSVGTDRQLLAHIEAGLGGARLDTLAIGTKFDSHFMRAAARIGGGHYRRVGPGRDIAGDIADAVREVVARARPAGDSLAAVYSVDLAELSDRGAAAVRMSFALAFALLAGVIVYRLRVDEV